MELAGPNGSRRQVIPGGRTIVATEMQQRANAARDDNNQGNGSCEQARDTDLRRCGPLACRSLPELAIWQQAKAGIKRCRVNRVAHQRSCLEVGWNTLG